MTSTYYTVSFFVGAALQLPLLCSSVPLRAQDLPSGVMERRHELALLRMQGLKENVAKIPQLKRILAPRFPRDEEAGTAILALSRMKDSSCLPVLERLSVQNRDNRAKVARARILASLEADGVSDATERARVRIRTFLEEIGLSVATLNAGLARPPELRTHARERLELIALRTIADMVYRARDGELKQHVLSLGFNTASDKLTTVKLQLALSNPQERADWLVHHLASLKTVTFNEVLLLQLAADEGKTAAESCAAILARIRANRVSYPYQGIASQFQILQAVGEPAYADAIRPFLKDREPWVVHYAQQALMTLDRGLRTQLGADF